MQSTVADPAISLAHPRGSITHSDQWFGVKELSDYLQWKPAIGTIYYWVSKKKIPYHQPTGDSGKLQFLKSEIDNWLMQGRRMPTPSLEISNQ